MTNETLESRIERIARSVFQQEISRMLRPIVGSSDDEDDENLVLPASLAYKRLGYSSYKSLYEDIKAGVLREGIEIENRSRRLVKETEATIGRRRNARYYVNIGMARKRYTELSQQSVKPKKPRRKVAATT